MFALLGLLGVLCVPMNVQAASFFCDSTKSKIVGTQYAPPIKDGLDRVITDITGKRYSSSNSSVASVADDGSGIVCKKGGITTITVQYNGESVSQLLYVVDEFKIISQKHLGIGESSTIDVMYLAGGISASEPDNIDLTWKSQDESIVTVGKTSGKITAISAGTTEITATGNIKNKGDTTCTVTVHGPVKPNFNSIKNTGKALQITWSEKSSPVKSSPVKYTLSRRLKNKNKKNRYSVVYEGENNSYTDTNVVVGEQYDYQLTYQTTLNGKTVTSDAATKNAVYYGPNPAALKIKKKSKNEKGTVYYYINWTKRSDRDQWVDLYLKIGKNGWSYKATKNASSGYFAIPKSYFGPGKNQIKLVVYKTVNGKTLYSSDSNIISINI